MPFSQIPENYLWIKLKDMTYALQDKYSMSINADENISLSYQSSKTGKYWGYVDIGWIGDGTGIKVLENVKKDKIDKALAKLSDEEKELLGLIK